MKHGLLENDSLTTIRMLSTIKRNTQAFENPCSIRVNPWLFSSLSVGLRAAVLREINTLVSPIASARSGQSSSSSSRWLVGEKCTLTKRKPHGTGQAALACPQEDSFFQSRKFLRAY